MTTLQRFAALGALCLAAAACTVAPGVPTSAPTTTVPTSTTAPPAGSPVIGSFAASSSNTAAPALVALSWSVSDPQGDPLTCWIDGNGDGTDDVTIANCQTPGSRNVTLSAAGTVQARLRASDGTNTTQTTRSITTQSGTSESFDIVVRPVAPLDPAVQALFDSAVARWQQILVRGIPSVNANLSAGACLAGAAPIGTVDDLVIDVEIAAIDGVGGVLGSAGPCIVGSSDGLPRVGSMTFDSADVAALLASGRLSQVILHEMAHVVGVGTIWQSLPGLVSGFTGSDPRFLGPRSGAAWSTMGRSGTVPVEADGGSGTAYAHWDETTFDAELMTGWLDAGANPLSAVSVASLADMGFRVDIGAADLYSPPTLGAFRLGASLTAPEIDYTEILRTPIGAV